MCLMMKLALVILIPMVNFEMTLILIMSVTIMSSLEISQMYLEGLEILNWIKISLIILSIWLMGLMMMSNFRIKNNAKYMIVVFALIISLVWSFFVNSLLLFYFFFEVVLIPIFMMILGWGYQPERFNASLYMFFYTLCASLPLFMLILFIGSNLGTSFISVMKFKSIKINFTMSIFMMMAFLVKFPIYLFHIWLPKAHVEAPVSGSMILAGILLKLGGYGLYLVMALSQFYEPLFSELMKWMSLVGSGMVALLITRLTDMKVIIAYSSVVHMGMVIASIMTYSIMGLMGALIMMIAHGLTSSGMFMSANLMYEQSHSRSLSSNKGILGMNSTISAIWFTLIVLNFAGPFTLNLMSEVMMIISLLSVSLMISLPIIMLCFLSAAYNLVLYASSQQGSSNFSLISSNMNNNRELVGLWSHVWPCFSIIMIMMILISNMSSI